MLQVFALEHYKDVELEGTLLSACTRKVKWVVLGIDHEMMRCNHVIRLQYFIRKTCKRTRLEYRIPENKIRKF